MPMPPLPPAVAPGSLAPRPRQWTLVGQGRHKNPAAAASGIIQEHTKGPRLWQAEPRFHMQLREPPSRWPMRLLMWHY